MRLEDVIAAPITGVGGAVCVIRISGAGTWDIGRGLFRPFPATPESHRAYYGEVAGIDDGLLTLFAEGKSYTGQESAELSIHGSPAAVAAVLEKLRELGVRSAEPGEFTYRAFANGRLDLSQAESVRDIVEAESAEQLRLAHRQKGGAVRDAVEEIRTTLIRLLAEVEAHVDFSEEIGEPDRPDWIERLKHVKAKIEALLRTADTGRILRQGLRILILGRPNAGKSSLLNALLLNSRAIVSATPGTTRDYLEERALIGGVPCVLIDTAGLRETGDEVESIGVNRSRELIAGADRIWYLYDAAAGWSAEDDAELRQITGAPIEVLATKADLAVGDRGLPVSSTTRDGLTDLVDRVKSYVPEMNIPFAIAARHEPPLIAVQGYLETARGALRAEMPFDLVATSLRESIFELGTITGETASIDMIERIFGEFCIGK